MDLNGHNLRISMADPRISDHCRGTVRVRVAVRIRVMIRLRFNVLSIDYVRVINCFFYDYLG